MDNHILPDTTDTPTPERPARLGPLVIDAMRLIRTLKSEYVAVSELLQLALEMVREKDAELDQVRARCDALIMETRDLRRQLQAARRAA